MAFNISNFTAQGLKYGGIRPSLFDVTITPPTNVGSTASGITQFNFMCKAASIPQMDVSPIDVPYFGRKIKVAGERPSFPNWEVEVMCDEDYAVRAMFEKWNDSINRLVSNIRDPRLDSEGADGYKNVATVNSYGKDGSTLRIYEFIGIWPCKISEIKLDWDSSNKVGSFMVEFAYDYWLPAFEVSTKGSGADTYLADSQSSV